MAFSASNTPNCYPPESEEALLLELGHIWNARHSTVFKIRLDYCQEEWSSSLPGQLPWWPPQYSNLAPLGYESMRRSKGWAPRLTHRLGQPSLQKREAQWPIGYGVGLRIKRSSVRIRLWPLRWVLGQGSLLPLSQGEAFTLASISYLAILVKYIMAKKKKRAYWTSKARVPWCQQTSTRTTNIIRGEPQIENWKMNYSGFHFLCSKLWTVVDASSFALKLCRMLEKICRGVPSSPISKRIRKGSSFPRKSAHSGSHLFYAKLCLII